MTSLTKLSSARSLNLPFHVRARQSMFRMASARTTPLFGERHYIETK